jgi:hypothetical protein
MSKAPFLVASTLGLLSACGGDGGGQDPVVPTKPTPTSTAVVTVTPTPTPTKAGYGALERQAFNRAAVRLDLPLYWTTDRNGNGAVDPDEVATLLFYPTATSWVEADKKTFSAAFDEAYRRLVEVEKDPLAGVTGDDEIARRKLVLQDLDQGRATLVRTDLTSAKEQDKELVRRMQAVAKTIDTIYAREAGIDVLAAQVPKDDLASQSLFRRNWGPQCLGPKTEKEPKCSAIPGSPKPKCDAYPQTIQKDDTTKFCEVIEKHPDSKKLLSPFVVVREQKNKLVAVPLHEAYPELMKQASGDLHAAAEAVTDPAESALKAYLEAASKSFSTNDWVPADEAWAKMNAQNSRWYVRVAPDETYWDPCNHKAGFHVTFALINPDSVGWQGKLSPIRQEMEQSLADLVGAPYKARKVDFHLPDFIDIVFNAGDDRDPFGATIGQSLPNWGPVADGRGRTVAMSNLYTDADSLRTRRELASALFTKDTLDVLVDDKGPGLLATILHEATHNLGPAHEYKVKGKTDEQIFGGQLAATFEELKAQSGALWYIAMLQKKALLTPELAKQTYVDSIYWTFGHISRGMYSDNGQRKPYSQLSAIQLGFLMSEGAITFDPKAKAANGKDEGAFTVQFDKLPAAVDKMMKVVGHIKAAGDKPAAEALAKKYVDSDLVPQKLITERMLRSPKASFVYALDL